MKKSFLAAALGLAVVVAGYAGEDPNSLPTTITLGKVTYEDVRWGAVTPATVTIMHKSGIVRIPLENLPADLQQHFGYDPQKAAAYRALEQTAQKKRIQQDAESAAKRAEVAAKQTENAAFEADRKSKALVGERLLDRETIRSESKEIMGTVWEKRADGTILDGILTEDLPFLANRRQQGLPMKERMILLNYFPTNAVGKGVITNAVPINPIDGMRAFDMGKVPTFDEWKALKTP